MELCNGHTKAPVSLFEFFLQHEHVSVNLTPFNSQEHFLRALRWKLRFRRSIKAIKKEHPERGSYYSSLLNKAVPFDSTQIRNDYINFRMRKKFDKLSQRKQLSLEKEYANQVLNLPQSSIERFATRSRGQIVPEELHLMESYNQSVRNSIKETEEAKEDVGLMDLPEQLLVQVLQYMDPFTVFKMTLVSKSWREVVLKNSDKLKKAEFCFAMYTINFPEMIKNSRFMGNRTYFDCYRRFAWNLIKWYAGISGKLETLNLHFPVKYSELMTLLESCPHLENLQITMTYCSRKAYFKPTSSARLKLPKLKTFVLESFNDPYTDDLAVDILSAASSLVVYKGCMNMEIWHKISKRRSIGDLFSNLLGLKLESVTLDLLEALAKIESFKLRYLELGHFIRLYSNTEWNTEIRKSREAFHKILCKVPDLEVLITSMSPGVTDETMQLLISLDLRLKYTVLYQSYSFDLMHKSPSLVPDRPCIKGSTLKRFEQMINEQNKSNVDDWSCFSIVVADWRFRSYLQQKSQRLSVIHIDPRLTETIQVHDLEVLKAKGLIDLEF